MSQQIGTLSGMHSDGQFDAASREQKIYHGSESLALNTQLEVIFTCRCQFLHLNILFTTTVFNLALLSVLIIAYAKRTVPSYTKYFDCQVQVCKAKELLHLH